MKIRHCFPALAVLAAGTCRILAADYEGADAVLKKISSQPAPEAMPADKNQHDSFEKLRADLKAFRATAASLPPADAAKTWLQFVDRFSKLPQNQGNNITAPPYEESRDEKFSFSLVISSLPPPAAWPELARQVDARKEDATSRKLEVLALRLLAHRLIGNRAKLKNDVTELNAFIQKNPEHDALSRYAIEQAAAEETKNFTNQDVINGFNAEVERIRTHMEYGSLRVPDLVTLAGAEKAKEFLKPALEYCSIYTVDGNATKALLQKLTLEMMPELKDSQWWVVNTIDAVALYEAMEKRFPNEKPEPPLKNGDLTGRTSAQNYYMLGLVTAGRLKDAVALASKTDAAIMPKTFPEDALDAVKRAGHMKDLVQFLHDVLSDNPNLPYWDLYADLSLASGQPDQMFSLMEKNAEPQKGLEWKSQQRILNRLSHGYLAVGRVEEGVAVLRKEIERLKHLPTIENPEYFERRTPGLALDLANLGVLLDRKDWIEEGIKTARETLENPVTRRGDQRATEETKSLAGLLFATGRGPEAEEVLRNGIAISEKPQVLLMALMSLYQQAKRPADVLSLLDDAPQWSAKDLGEITYFGTSFNHRSDDLLYVVADSLAALNREPEARKILDALMDTGSEPAADRNYELLLKLTPAEEVVPRLDELFARDRFEKRPLIWKAQALFDAGKLEDAEITVRQAIAIDPSDGEAPAGARMHAYEVLANIREARGDAKEAQSLRNLVAAVRQSEKADDFYYAGLTSRAIEMHRESLARFEGAYCIQWRLASLMTQNGDQAGAEEHYRRAYELMPGSFGRVESHCLSCENAFTGYYAQGIADKVFLEMEKKQPKNPQLHYLLGSLRKTQNRDYEALAEFREAVKLDPDYLNAWNEIRYVSESINFPNPVADNDAALFNMLRLNPLGPIPHFGRNVDGIWDLAAVWKLIEAGNKLRPVLPETLYPLAASAAELGKQLREAKANDDSVRYRFGGYDPAVPVWGMDSPGYRISETEFFKEIDMLMVLGNFSFDDPK